MNSGRTIRRFWVTLVISTFIVATSRAADWIRAGLNTNRPVWGLRGGLLFAIHPGGFSTGEGGPRGLIRIGYPTLPGGGYDLINFIAVEPVVNGRRGLSELEHSDLDDRRGKRFWVGPSKPATNAVSKLEPGQVSSPSAGVEELAVTVFVERFKNGALVRLVLAQRSDTPDELRLTVHAEPDSAAMDSCIFSATMGNKARTRLLWLKEGSVSSLKLYPDYRGWGFAPHTLFALDRLPRSANGDVLVAVSNDEENPAAAKSFDRLPFWNYRGAKVTQYWRKPAAQVRDGLQCAVNGRFTYWMSLQPIPGGIAYENFELREKFHDGQQAVFGVTRRTPPGLLK